MGVNLNAGLNCLPSGESQLPRSRREGKYGGGGGGGISKAGGVTISSEYMGC